MIKIQFELFILVLLDKIIFKCFQEPSYKDGSRRSVVKNALDIETGGPGFDPRSGVLKQNTIYLAHILAIMIDIQHFVPLSLSPTSDSNSGWAKTDRPIALDGKIRR